MEGLYLDKMKEYNKINNSFERTVIFHVGASDGFHSEVDAMMQCMLFCYVNKIKFVLYSDDANFSGGRGWQEFFVPFCEENHDFLNRVANPRYRIKKYRVITLLLSKILKKRTKADYLTAEIFEQCIPRTYSMQIEMDWPLFNIKGKPLLEFAKLKDIAFRYNDHTKKEVKELIQSVNLPEEYTSIQFRGGDKILEMKELMNVESILQKIEDNKIEVDHLFIFTDDYKYVEEVKKRKPNWKVYTLTQENESGYCNKDFNKLPWRIKRSNMIKLFAMVDICIESKLHLGCEQACVNNYIKSVKGGNGYFPIMERNPR